jgi:hypothetical protein
MISKPVSIGRKMREGCGGTLGAVGGLFVISHGHAIALCRFALLCRCVGNALGRMLDEQMPDQIREAAAALGGFSFKRRAQRASYSESDLIVASHGLRIALRCVADKVRTYLAH